MAAAGRGAVGEVGIELPQLERRLTGTARAVVTWLVTWLVEGRLHPRSSDAPRDGGKALAKSCGPPA
eukprot:1594470-Prymnesium_polylepis.1